MMVNMSVIVYKTYAILRGCTHGDKETLNVPIWENVGDTHVCWLAVCVGSLPSSPCGTHVKTPVAPCNGRTPAMIPRVRARIILNENSTVKISGNDEAEGCNP